MVDDVFTLVAEVCGINTKPLNMKKTTLSIIFLCSILFVYPSAHVEPVFNNPFSSVNYVGAKENGLAFDLFWDISNGRDVTVSITNNNNELIYQQTFKDKKSLKRFVLPNDSNGTFTFLIRSGKMRYEKRFTVARQVTETLQVTEE